MSSTKGRAWFEQVMGTPAPPFPPDPFLDSTMDHLFADVWSRPGLSVRDRRLVTLTVLIQLGNENALRMHLGATLRQQQLTDVELDELILHVAHYGGWPGAALASQVLRQLRAELPPAPARTERAPRAKRKKK